MTALPALAAPLVLCCRREGGSPVMLRNRNWKRLLLPTFLAAGDHFNKKADCFMTFYTRLYQIWVYSMTIPDTVTVVCIDFSREGCDFCDLPGADTLRCFVLDLMNCDQRSCHCSCFCPFCKTQDLSSGQTRCLLMLLSSTFVLHCQKMESHQFQKFLNFHFPYFLPSSQTLRPI